MVEYMSLTREQRLAEKGSEPPCPFCGRARVSRSDYIRCNRCGLNWMNGEDINLNPHLSREPYLTTKATASTKRAQGGGAPTAE